MRKEFGKFSKKILAITLSEKLVDVSIQVSAAFSQSKPIENFSL